MRGRKPKLSVVVPGKKWDETTHRPPKSLAAGGYFEPTAKLGRHGAAEWARIRALCPWIGPGSAAILTERCRQTDTLERALRAIKKDGDLIVTTRGTILNPMFSIAEKARQFIFAVDKELGLTPVSQVRIGAGLEKPEIDPIDEALFG